jgi:glycosyltransferase involved in cell wall biosynthesis
MAKFSIIIPVRNGGNYLKQAVESILAQTYQDFNLLILESGSTDGSIEYIQLIKDERVVLYTIPKTLGIEDNWARILQTDRNEFMTILGQDDILLPHYLEVMNALITEHPDASLYQTHFNQINAKGGLIRHCQKIEAIEPPDVFLTSILDNTIDFMASGFMMRCIDYDAIGGIPNYPNLLFADFELFMELTKVSFLAVSPQTCFEFRIHQSTTTVSADQKFQQAFAQFIGYLEKLRNENTAFKAIIADHAENFLLFYCKGLVHRLIRKPKKMRPEVSVANFIQQCKTFAAKLMPGKPFEPEKVFSIKLAKWIDRSAITRKAFLLYKKIYSKPVL